MQTPPKHRVLVLGAGVCGLSSAVRIQESRDDVDVTIWSEKFSPNTTSDGAGGFWEVYSAGNTDPALVKEVSTETYRHLLDLSWSPLAGKVKVQRISGYVLRDGPMEELDFKDTVDSYRRLTDEEIARVPGAKDGRFFTTLSVDVTAYLTWLTRRFLSNGGALVQRKVNSVEELSGDWDVVVNCIGLGAYQLLNDHSMQPIRGQVFRVSAPWIKHFCVFETKVDGGYRATYVLPNADSVVVGGTFQEGNWNTDVKEDDSKEIWTKAVNMMASLKEARVIRQWAGLRPVRDSLRLESELMTLGKHKRRVPVVHNYGHGGIGVTLHWGCARKVTEMVTHCLRHAGDSSSNSHKHSEATPNPRSKL